MKNMFRNTLISLFFVFLQSCYSLNNNMTSKDEEGCISYLYVNNLDTCVSSKITLFSNGVFLYTETNHYVLGEHCNCNEGRWFKNGDSIYLTTLFQNTLNDYITELGSIEFGDSIYISIYSLRTMKPSNDFAYVNNKNNLIIPNAEGNFCVPCSEKENLEKQLLIGVFDSIEDGVLRCGRKYRCYIKDCIPKIMRKERLILTDSTLIDIETKREYFRE